MNLAPILRCIAEAHFTITLSDVQPFQEKIACTDRHIQIFDIFKSIVGINQCISCKRCAYDIRDEFGVKRKSALPVKIISPTKKRTVLAFKINQAA